MAQDVNQVEETLATIRRLMERGQRYEAVTGKGALVAGLAAVAMAGFVGWIARADPFPALVGHDLEVFVAAWAVLALACVAWIIRGAMRLPFAPEASSEGRFSHGARAVGRAVLPAYVAAVGITLGGLAWRNTYLPGAWMCLHGVAILATAHHAPARLVKLGWAFVVLGVLTSAAFGLLPFWLGPNKAMALGFGGLNIAYGLFSLLRPLPRED